MAANTHSHPPNWSTKRNSQHIAFVEVFLVATLLITAYFIRLNWWEAIIVGCIGGILGFLVECLTYRGHTFMGWLGVWILYRLRKNKPVKYDSRSYLGEYEGIGSITLEDTFLSVIELHSPTRTPVFVDRGIAEHSINALIPMDALIDALYQYDVKLESIDIINIGHKQVHTSAYDRIYSQLNPSSPAMGFRRTFVVIKLRPSALLNPIMKRGGGSLGMSKTINIVTNRAMRLLREEGITADTLSLDEIMETMPLLSKHLTVKKYSSTDETELRERWKYLENGHTGFISTFAVDPGAWTVENQNSWWSASTEETAQIVRLKPAGQDIRDGANVYGWIRYVTKDELSTDIIETSGLRLLHGRQKEAASLVLYRCSPDKDIDCSPLHVRVGDDRFAIPIGASGQYFGRTVNNKQVYLDLFSTDSTRIAPRIVAKNVDTRFIMQVILRALSVGAKIKIYSPDWKKWNDLIYKTRSHNIWLEGENDRDDANLILYDRSPARGEHSSKTIISLDSEDHFPKNVTITITVPDLTNKEILHIDLGDRVGIVKWTSSKAEEQFTGVYEDYSNLVY